MLKPGIFILVALALLLTACNGGTTTPGPVGVGTLVVESIGTPFLQLPVGTPNFTIPQAAFVGTPGFTFVGTPVPPPPIGTPFGLTIGTPVSQICIYKITRNAFCREGPGGPSDYDARDTLILDQEAEIVGVSPNLTHYYVIGPNNFRVCALPVEWGVVSESCQPELLPRFTPEPTNTNTATPRGDDPDCTPTFSSNNPCP